MSVTAELHSQGKVRDIYDAGDGRLLMVTSDRMSAFDVVMKEPIPSKGNYHWRSIPISSFVKLRFTRCRKIFPATKDSEGTIPRLRRARPVSNRVVRFRKLR